MCLLIFPTNINIAVAQQTEKVYSNVLDDLQKDKSFKKETYPYVEDDYSLQVIQVAESEDNELFVYVYQPSGEKGGLVASSINMSTASDVHKSNYQIYKLTLVNSNGMFYKYIVDDYIVSNLDERNYEIASIYRPWNESIDEDAENGNVVTYVSYEVAKLFTIVNVDGKTQITCYDTEVITISDKYVGFVRYDGGYVGSPGMGVASWLVPGTDSHFVAFSTDKPIDKLFEATVYYSSQSYYYSKNSPPFFEEKETFGEIKEGLHENFLYTDSVTIKIPQGLITGREYEFERIQSVEQFIETENRNYVYDMLFFNVREEQKITDEGLKDLEGKQWVLRFLETDYSDKSIDWGVIVPEHRIEKTIISDVSILELKFETDGIVYDLGVVDNMQSGDLEPDNETNIFFELADWVKWLFGILFTIFIILVIIVLWPIISFIGKILWKIIKKLYKAIKYCIKSFLSLFDKGEGT